MNKINFIASLILGLGIGLSVGWVIAHNIIAVECQRLSGFYVGNQIFICMEKP
jgi:hypothetical protein